jgi:hypothetical protein
MRVEKLLSRLRREFIKVNFLQAVLDTIIVFLSVNMVLYLFNVTLVSASNHYRVLIGGTFVFFLSDWIYRSRKYRLEIYEEKNPELQEILRTARDNLNNQNIVSQAMFDDLMDRARSVTSESIIPEKKIIQKIAAVGVLSFLTVVSGLISFQPVKESQEVLTNLDPEDVLDNDVDVLKNASDIYGEKKDIEAVSTDLQINITGESYGQDSFDGEFDPKEFVFEAASPERPEDAELAKRYSLAIKDME